MSISENQGAKRVGNPAWKKGVSGNPAGRPRGKAEHRKVLKARQEVFAAVAEFVVDADKNYKSSVQLLMDFANNEKLQPSLRISAAQAAAPYQFARKLSVAPPQFIHTEVGVPDFDSIEAAESFLAELTTRVASAELDYQSSDEIARRVQGWINNKRADQELEVKRLNAGQESGDQIIKIEGGLPSLPGTNVTMPHEANGHVLADNDAQGLLTPQPGPRTIEHVEASSSQIESTPTDPSAQD